MDSYLLSDLKTQFKSFFDVRNMIDDSSKLQELFQFILHDSEYRDEYKNKFFIEIDKTLIFNKNNFLLFLDSQLLGESYTKYLNKIGLSYENEKNTFFKNNNNIVINFPYKDCVLEGTQSKEDQKITEEHFFNEIIEENEIDVLFNPKAFNNFQFCDSEGLVENDFNALKKYIEQYIYIYIICWIATQKII